MMEMFNWLNPELAVRSVSIKAANSPSKAKVYSTISNISKLGSNSKKLHRGGLSCDLCALKQQPRRHRTQGA